MVDSEARINQHDRGQQVLHRTSPQQTQRERSATVSHTSRTVCEDATRLLDVTKILVSGSGFSRPVSTTAFGAPCPFPLALAKVGYLNAHRPFSLGGRSGSRCPEAVAPDDR